MKASKPLRLVVLLIACLALAVLLAIQSIGIVYTKDNPVTASKLFKYNGLAQENVASALFRASISDQVPAVLDSLEIESWARSSYLLEPLTPDSQSLIARSIENEAERSRFVALASQLNRRDQSLQGLVLEEHIRANEFPEVIDTLDRILRVKPSRTTDLFPLLLTVFAKEGAVDEFEYVLDGSAPWHRKFITRALGDPPSLPNLYELRLRRPFDDEDQDRLLVQKLAMAGDLRLASELHQQLATAGEEILGENKLSWSTAFPPFDWVFTDEADLRAQPGLGSNKLEVYIRPGEGGVLAKRVIQTPSSPFTLSLEHRIVPQVAHKDMRLILICADNGRLIAEEQFGVSGASISVETVPVECAFVEIVITGRAWTGQSTLRGDISPIELR